VPIAGGSGVADVALVVLAAMVLVVDDVVLVVVLLVLLVLVVLVLVGGLIPVVVVAAAVVDGCDVDAAGSGAASTESDAPSPAHAAPAVINVATRTIWSNRIEAVCLSVPAMQRRRLLPGSHAPRACFSPWSCIVNSVTTTVRKELP
jgi:hypothetical protein